MRFVDEAHIRVEAGKGGDGCSSFRREKFIPFGGPDGGNGGAGGSIYLVASAHLNTLVDFRYKRLYRAKKGEQGKGALCTGAKGDDMLVKVPVGTTVYEADTNELIGDLMEDGQRLLVARGGHQGTGNAAFKSSTNRAPRRFTPGVAGEQRDLRLELKVLADVGLLGLPNAGKSTLLRAVSAAKPKVADYPFTTMYPNLGLVRVDHERSFVIADIPGLIAGAADGAGLGTRFLKHLSRTHLLLHLIDVMPVDGSDPVENAKAIVKELENFSPELAAKPRWLVFNKVDLLPNDQLDEHCNNIAKALQCTEPVLKISALSKQGTEQLCYQLMDAISQSN